VAVDLERKKYVGHENGRVDRFSVLIDCERFGRKI
jgi:hypothetical protein